MRVKVELRVEGFPIAKQEVSAESLDLQFWRQTIVRLEPNDDTGTLEWLRSLATPGPWMEVRFVQLDETSSPQRPVLGQILEWLDGHHRTASDELREEFNLSRLTDA